MPTSFRALISASCLSIALAACGSDDAPPREASPARVELPRALTSNEQSLIDASGGFGLQLTAQVLASDARTNVVLSPLSASMALGMTLNGADGATFDAMRAALGFGSLTQEQINASYRELIDLLRGLDPRVRFEIANAVWANENVAFHEEFLRTVTAAFDARAESRPFSDPAAADAINDWVSDHTDGRIDSIVDGLDPALVMLLANAVYFDGEWTTQFDNELTRPQPFTREDGGRVEVDMMSIEDVEISRAFGPSYSAIELPYGGEAFSMIVVLPDASTSARGWLAELDSDGWAALTDALAPGRLNLLSLPRLELTYDGYLNDALQAMGMGPAFRPGADFTRMSPLGNQLCIDFVRQKTFIEVDEQGTRAAAATGAGVGVVSFAGFVADRPFVFFIRERLSGTILFVGLVGDPTAEDPGPEPLVSECTNLLLP